MVGMDLSTAKDADGKSFVKERIDIAKTKGKGWQDYKFTNPSTKKIEQKTAYIERVDDLIFGCGSYKN
jgi:cytochrome c